MFRLCFQAAGVLWFVSGCLGGASRLYTEDDPLVILGSSSLKPTISNSSSAWLVQFYSSWCGHCIHYSSTWKVLAQDVKDWQEAIGVAVLDCAQEENFDACRDYNIQFYPTFKYFRAHSSPGEKGTAYRGADRGVQSIRQLMVNILQNHTRLEWPQHCPSLEPYSEKKLRFFFSSLLRTLPGVQRRSSSAVAHVGAPSGKQDSEPWRDFNRSQVYTADLESALHYLLRVELAAHSMLEGEKLKVFKDFVTLVSKLYPGGGSVVKLMETLSDWLLSLPLQRIPYQACSGPGEQQDEGVFLGEELRWVGCQGSRPGLRGYPCSLWTLFHVLTVQHDAMPNALDNTGLEVEAAPVLQVMRHYIRTFFGCQECGQHFEQAVAAGIHEVKSPGEQILWLWNQHNRVNARLAGSLSDDPLFPKAQWPSPSLCASCHEEQNGVHVWNLDNVLHFLRHHYSASNLSPKYSLTPPRAPAPSFDLLPTSKSKVEDRGGAAAGGGGMKAEEQPGPQPAQASPRPEMKDLVMGEGEGRGVWILGMGFNSVDMSLCVVLYVSSCLFLMLLFFFFKVRSRRWKLRHSRLHV
ncbi:Sulfhydryl oxidase 2 [Oryzias melastigma]|uniref:Sulfhydryl oxidase n=1 Tax=Oryzias melastigma TaxID=30732 RepID=A0A834F7K0_ORYME|nr:Sulfhydryl oxidase 2 [Oryzias melastigma]